jgi:hypothetical protein
MRLFLSENVSGGENRQNQEQVKGKEEASEIFRLGTKSKGMSSSFYKFDGKTPPQKGTGENMLDANCI